MAKDQTKIALESMMGFVNERAMEIVALPLDQRAERYAMLKRINFDAAGAVVRRRNRSDGCARVESEAVYASRG